MNKDHEKVSDSEEVVRPKLCYISVTAIFLAVIQMFVMTSDPKTLVPSYAFAALIAVVALIRFKLSERKRRGKVLAILAIIHSLASIWFISRL